jgi:hypothetical protein
MPSQGLTLNGFSEYLLAAAVIPARTVGKISLRFSQVYLRRRARSGFSPDSLLRYRLLTLIIYPV